MTKPIAAFHKGLLGQYHARFDMRDMNPKRPLEVAVSEDEVSFRAGPFTLDCWPTEGILGEALGKLVAASQSVPSAPWEG